MEIEREFWEEFLNLYKMYPCLWNSMCPEYNNKVLKENAYSALIDFSKSRYPNASKQFVLKKIHNFRTTFRRQFKKVKNSQTWGVASDEVYTPRLWYYDLMSFIADCDTNRKDRFDNDETEDEEEYVISDLVSIY